MTNFEENGAKKGFYQKFLTRAFSSKDVQTQFDTSVSGADMKRVLGPLDLTLMGIGATIGSGVFVLTGIAASKYAGPAVSISYAIASLAAMLAALSFAEFGADLPVTGGAYNYVIITFGELPAWLCACTLMSDSILGSAATARGFTSYFASIFGKTASTLRLDVNYWISVDFPAFLVVLALGALLAKGTKDSSVANIVVTGMNLGVIVLVIFLGIPYVDSDNYADFAPYGVKGIFTGASQVFFSFLGFNNLCSIAEEVKNPGYDLPFGIFTSVSICTVLYIAMCLVLTGMRAYQDIDVDAAFSVAFHDLGVDWARSIIAIGAITGIVTSILVSLIVQTRLSVVLGRSYLIPPWFAKVDEHTRTPINSTIVTALISATFAFVLEIEILSQLVSAGSLFVFLLVNTGVLYRRYRKPSLSQVDTPIQWNLVNRMTVLILSSTGFTLSFKYGVPVWIIILFLLSWLLVTVSFCKLEVTYQPSKFSVPLKPFVPSLGVLVTIHLIGSLGQWAFLLLLGWLMVGFAVYLLYVMHKAEEFERWKKSIVDESLSGNGKKQKDDGIELTQQDHLQDRMILLSSQDHILASNQIFQ